MFKDPEEYDRRMTSLSKRNEDTQKSLESRNSRIKELSERKSEIRFGQDSIAMSRSRDSSLSRLGCFNLFSDVPKVNYFHFS